MKKYINIKDRQGGEWALGVVDTLKGWREYAIGWADSDGSYGLASALKRYSIKNHELIDYINDYWEITIVEFDENNEEHVELADNLMFRYGKSTVLEEPNELENNIKKED